MSEEKLREGRGNRLAGEKSPYLLQHAGNPVDWYPWGEEAFEAARRLDRPLFLSIGYATCHWCHVMERESFEDGEVAALMNEAFVSVKIDREERPDLDHFFMTLCQGLTGSGGWPLTVVMTPDRKPFFAGTYFPRTSRFGRIGMLELVPRISGIWREKRREVTRSAEEILSSLSGLSAAPMAAANNLDTGAVLEAAREEIASHFDPAHGGFGRAPKFPHPDYLRFLLRHWRRTGDGAALAMAEKTLTAMRLGGIYDHVGFGFHRYSTDERWLLPHFEKMLYDQALLSMVYTEAWQATGTPLYSRTAKEIFAYVLRDLQGKEGGFFSAEDADSEGEEGRFYLWTLGEVEEVLGKRAAAVAKAFGLKKEGNFVDEAGQPSESNIFHLAFPPGGEMKEPGLLPEEARAPLFNLRERRVRPLLDDKVLTDWNGLMIASLAKGGAAFGDEALTGAAERAAAFLLATMRSPRGRLLHRYREGEAAIEGHLDDYAFLAWGLLELYQATFREEYLSQALSLTDEMLSLFRDEKGGGLFFTSRHSADLPLRQKVLEDGSLPSGNSVAAFTLLRLARITGEHRFEEEAASILQGLGRRLEDHPSASCHLLGALESAEGLSHEVVVVGVPGRKDTEEMLRALRRSFQPNVVILFLSHGEDSPAIVRHAPHLEGLRAVEGRAAAYVCSSFQCGTPVVSVEELMERLGTGGNDGARGGS